MYLYFVQVIQWHSDAPNKVDHLDLSYKRSAEKPGVWGPQFWGQVEKHDPFDSRWALSPEIVTSKVSTGASKSVYQARPRTVTFPKKAGRANALPDQSAAFLHLPFHLTPPAI